MNLSDLTRMQRQWSALMTNTEFGGNGRLTEIEGFGSNPGDLRMLTYVPATLGNAAPLVVVLHGCGQTASGYDAGHGLVRTGGAPWLRRAATGTAPLQ